MNILSFRRLCIVLLLSAAMHISTIAETPEQVINPKTTRNEWVSDMAGVIDASTKSHINSLINQLEQKTGAEIAVVTIRRTDGRSPKEFATELFNRWEIGKKGEDNGVLVLLVMDARRVEVETGYGIESVLTDGKVGEILREFVIPQFKESDFSGGIWSGVERIAKTISGEEKTLSISYKKKDSLLKKLSKDGRFWLLIVVLIIIILSGFQVQRIRQGSIRSCSNCKRKMRKLSYEEKMAYMSNDQQWEERYRHSDVKYLVWRCNECQRLEIKRAYFWRLERASNNVCPKCGQKTLFRGFIIIDEPTYLRKGMEEIQELCEAKNCNYQDIHQRSISRLRTIGQYYKFSWSFGGSFLGGSGDSDVSGGHSWSSGNGGGSFGGGSSGGGGAGESW